MTDFSFQTTVLAHESLKPHIHPSLFFLDPRSQLFLLFRAASTRNDLQDLLQASKQNILVVLIEFGVLRTESVRSRVLCGRNAKFDSSGVGGQPFCKRAACSPMCINECMALNANAVERGPTEPRIWAHMSLNPKSRRDL